MSKRLKKKSDATSEVINVPKKVENSWVMLVRENLLNDNKNFNIITLPHPASGKPSKYCLDDANNKIYEVVTYDEPKRSWFIGDTVKSDGKIYMSTPVNPTFLILPRLRQECIKRAVPLEDLLSDKNFTKILEFVPNLQHIADLKGTPEMKAYKYNEEKTLSWLEQRVRRVAAVLREKNIHVGSGAVSATFVTSTLKNNDVDEEFYLKYAHGLVSEYLQEDLMGALEKKFNLQPQLIETLAKKRKSDFDDSEIKKKIKTEDESKENILDISLESPKIKKPIVLTNKEKARQKAASGTKTISSFFTKK